MRAAFERWWRERTTREQRLLLAAGALAGAVLVWLLVLRPLDAGLAEARQRHGAAVLRLADAHADAEALRRESAVAAPALAEPVEALVGRSAEEAGFAVSALVADGPGRARIAIPAARPPAFFAWVAELERRGLIVERLSASANSDRTLAAEAVFRARRG